MKYRSPDEAVAARGGKLSSVLLDTVLVSQLKKLNQIEFKGETHPFSEATIRTAIAGKRKQIATGPIWLMGRLGHPIIQQQPMTGSSFTLRRQQR